MSWAAWEANGFLFSGLRKASLTTLKLLEENNFFLGGDEENKPIPWVKWSEVMKNSEDGGLGITSLEHLNNALTAKWIWRFFKEPEAASVKIIRSIHGEDSLLFKPSDTPKGSN